MYTFPDGTPPWGVLTHQINVLRLHIDTYNTVRARLGPRLYQREDIYSQHLTRVGI